jgi:hypothetical protein
VHIVCNLFHPNVDTRYINANTADKIKASLLQFLQGPDLEPGTVTEYISKDSISVGSSKEIVKAFQNNHKCNLRRFNKILTVTEYACWLN